MGKTEKLARIPIWLFMPNKQGTFVRLPQCAFANFQQCKTQRLMNVFYVHNNQRFRFQLPIAQLFEVLVKANYFKQVYWQRTKPTWMCKKFRKIKSFTISYKVEEDLEDDFGNKPI